MYPNQIKAQKAHENYLRGRARMYLDNANTTARVSGKGERFAVKIQETGDDRAYVVRQMVYLARNYSYFKMEQSGDEVQAWRVGDYAPRYVPYKKEHDKYLDLE